MSKKIKMFDKAKKIPALPNFVLPADHGHVACLWVCPECDAKVWWTGEDTLTGSPMCCKCDIDMVLSEDMSLALTGRELGVLLELASIALADADIYDGEASRLGMCDADMKVLQTKINVIRETIRQ